MCLGMPGQIVEVKGDVAVADFWGTCRRVKLGKLEEPVIAGDYVIEHEGYAIRRIPIEQFADILGMYEVVLCEAGEDPIARDIVDRLECEEELEPELELV